MTHIEDKIVDLRTINSRLLDKGLVYFAVFVALGVTLSLLRTLEHGWNHIYFLHLAAGLAVIVGAFFRRHLSYRLRAGLLLGQTLLIGVVSLCTFGLVGGGLLVLVLFTILSALSFGSRAGLIACVISLGVTILIGIAVSSGKIIFSFDINGYATSITAWAVACAGLLVCLSTTILAHGVIHESLTKALEKLRENHADHRRLVDNLNGTFLYRHDIDGVFNYASSSVTQVLGYTPDELMSHYGDFLTDHPVNLKIADYTTQCINGNQQPPYEAQLSAKTAAAAGWKFRKGVFLMKMDMLLPWRELYMTLTTANRRRKSSARPWRKKNFSSRKFIIASKIFCRLFPPSSICKQPIWTMTALVPNSLNRAIGSMPWAPCTKYFIAPTTFPRSN